MWHFKARFQPSVGDTKSADRRADGEAAASEVWPFIVLNGGL